MPFTDRLTIRSPIATGVALYPPSATFGPRQIRDFEFVWMIEGDAEYRWGDETVAAPVGSIVLCRPGATDFFSWDKKRRTKHGYFHFDIQRFPRSWGRPSQWPLVRRAAEGDVLRPLFRHLLTWHQRGNAELETLTIQHMLTAFVTGEHGTTDVPSDVLPPAVERAMAYIYKVLENDPAAPIYLEDLAKVGCVTSAHLCRLFKSSTSRTPMETVRLARLDRSAILLTRSNYLIKEVATLCGFASSFHFSRCFSQAFNLSPRAMRQQIARGMAPPTSLLLRQWNDLPFSR